MIITETSDLRNKSNLYTLMKIYGLVILTLIPLFNFEKWSKTGKAQSNGT